MSRTRGGWGVLALASRHPRTLTAAINFAGGRGGRMDDKPNNNCARDRLVNVAHEFGRTARTPTLWLYSENDSYFAPTLAQRMVDAFRSGGGKAEYHALARMDTDLSNPRMRSCGGHPSSSGF